MNQPLNILMMEDSPTDAELIQRTIRKEFPECRFQLTHTKETFLKALEEGSPDLILADNSLPQFDAMEALKIIRERGVQLPYIMVSGTTNEEYAVRIMKAGADDYILKDRLTRLPAAIEAALRHREAEAEKRRVAAELELSEEKYRTIVDRISDGLLIMDKHWRVLYANQMTDKVFGKPVGYLQGKMMNEEFPQAVGRPFFNGYLRAMETGELQFVEEYSVVADRWLQANLYPSENGVAVFFRDVTDQRKAEAEVKKSEEQFRILLERMSDGFIVLDTDWRAKYVNRAAEKMFNRPPGYLLGKRMQDEFPGSEKRPFLLAYGEAVRTGEKQYVEEYAPTIDAWLQANIYPTDNGVAVFFRDITIRKKAELAVAKARVQLEESEAKYRTMVERISDGFMVLDRNWLVTYINPAAEKLLNRPAGYLLGKLMHEEFPGALDRPFFMAYEAALRSGQNKYIEEYSVSINRWFQASIYPGLDGVAVFFRDITEQRRAEEEVRKSEEKYRTFIHRITDAFISLDRNWCFTYLNKQAGEMMRRKPEELIGKNIWAVLPDAVHSATYRAFNQSLLEQRYMLNVDYYASLDLWQENHIYPSADGVSVFIRNITEKKKLELELHDQQKKEQQRMIAVAIEAQEKERNAIAAELHDNVNQILVGTKVMLSVLRDHPEKAASIIQQCMDNLSDAISENRKIAHELVTPDLRTESLVNQLTDLAAMMLQPAGIEFSLQDEALREELLNEQRKLAVYRVAQEQCTNIVKYAKAGLVVMTLGTEYDQLLFRVTDDGVGADPEKTYKGIGLQNIRNRIAVFGGTVLVNTGKGEGFELEINIPL